MGVRQVGIIPTSGSLIIVILVMVIEAVVESELAGIEIPSTHISVEQSVVMHPNRCSSVLPASGYCSAGVNRVVG
jgi:hypothetical protein